MVAPVASRLWRGAPDPGGYWGCCISLLYSGGPAARLKDDTVARIPTENTLMNKPDISPMRGDVPTVERSEALLIGVLCDRYRR